MLFMKAGMCSRDWSYWSRVIFVARVVAKTVKFLKTEVVVDIFWTAPKP